MENGPINLSNSNTIKTIAIVVIAVIAFFAASYGYEYYTNQNVTETTEWEKFSSPVGKFQILFPEYPTHETEDIPVEGTDAVVKADSYIFDQTEVAYFVETAEYPPEVDVSDTNLVLENSLNGMVSSLEGNKVTFTELTKVENLPAMNFIIVNDIENLSFKGQAFLNKQRIYLVMLTYLDGYFDEENYNKFINSFKLL